MSQVHGEPVLQGCALPMTVSNGAVERLIAMPACAKSVFSCAISWSREGCPLSYCRLNDALAPIGTPAPHWPDPVPGLVQMLVPSALTIHPLALSRAIALLGSYGYGLLLSNESTKFEDGLVGTGPYVG